MSCYEWERGEIKLPAKVASSFRKELGGIIDGYHEKAYRAALLAYQQVLAKFKGKRNVEFRGEIEDAFDAACGRLGLPDGTRYEHFYDVDGIFFAGDRKRPRPVKPKLKSFPTKCTPSKGIHFESSDFSLVVKGKQIVWYVSENNHACDHAHEHPVAKALFRMLYRVKWTRGSGGEIIGSDEYRYDAGLGAETKHCFQYESPKSAFNSPSGRSRAVACW